MGGMQLAFNFGIVKIAANVRLITPAARHLQNNAVTLLCLPK